MRKTPHHGPSLWTDQSGRLVGSAHPDVGLTEPCSHLVGRRAHWIGRRSFIVYVFATGGVGLHVNAQTPGAKGMPSPSAPSRKPVRIGLVFNNTPVAEMTGADPIDRNARAFVHGLRDLGLAEGRDVIIERRSALGRPERGPVLLRELADLEVDVLVTTGRPLLLAGPQAADRVPLVFVGVADPVAAGLVRSLARPGGNITGLTFDTGPAIQGKRLELLKEIAPGISRVALLFPTLDKGRWAAVQSDARALKLTVLAAVADTAADFDKALAGIDSDRVQALLVPQSGASFGAMSRIIEFAARRRLPAVYELREYAHAGGLMSYGADLADLFRRAAGYVDKILKGTRPADLPVEQPAKFELVINLKTANALGLSIPQSMLLRDDEVIQ
jgi:putative ABC transport system substrate-binding protein